jgi:hypothetical protein
MGLGDVGTNFLIRSAAFRDAGWSPEYTLTEDFALGMVLKMKKWHCRYVEEYLAVGEAPEQVRNCFQQRSRWCKVRSSFHLERERERERGGERRGEGKGECEREKYVRERKIDKYLREREREERERSPGVGFAAMRAHDRCGALCHCCHVRCGLLPPLELSYAMRARGHAASTTLFHPGNSI